MSSTMDEEQQPARRRVALRRGRSGGFSASQSTQTETLRGADEADDEVDDVIDVNTMARDMRALPPPQQPQAPAAPDEAGAIRARLNAVAAAGSVSYTKEHRRQVVARLLQRGYGLDMIAQQLQCSISTVEKDRADIKRAWREKAKGLDIYETIGEETAAYDEIGQLSMRIAGASGTGPGAVPIPMRLAAMRTHLASRADKSRFLMSAGVYDVLRFRMSEDGTDLSDVQMLMQRTQELIDNVLSQEEQEAAPAKPKRIMRRKGGFKAHTFDDADASTSSTETQEL